MSYYDYEPNSSYYYDEYHQYPENGMAYDDPIYVDFQVSQHKRFARSSGSYASSKSFISSTRNSLHNYYIVSQESLPEENQFNMPHYVVPVVYAPSKVVSLAPHGHKPVRNRTLSHESIDRYFSDDKNIQREASAYKRIIRRKLPRDVIREEPESMTSGSESAQFSEKERSDTEFSERLQTPCKQTKRPEMVCPQKNDFLPQVRKKPRVKDQEPNTIKFSPVGEEIEDRGKKEDTKKQRTEVQNITSEPLPNKCREKTSRPLQRSRSTLHKKVFLSHISHMPISCIPSTSNAPIKKEAKRSKSDTKLERKSTKPLDMQKSEGTSSKPKDAKIDYYSVSDISQCMKSNDKTKLIGWRNKSISEESTTNNTSSVPSDVSKLSNVASKNSENTDSININTEEYEEFLASIVEKPLKTNDSSDTHFMSRLFNKTFKFDKSNQSLDFKYEIDNAPVSVSVTPNTISTTMTPVTNLKLPEKQSQTEIEVKTTVSVSKNLAELKPRPLQVPKLEMAEDNNLECGCQKTFKTNPLADFDISSKNLFGHDVSVDFPEERFKLGREGNCSDKSSSKKAFFMKMIRYLGNFITSVRNISYKYVFRYILFI